MRKAFTLIELVLVLGIMIVIGAIVFATLAGRRSNADLTSVTQRVATLLRQAQSDAVAQQNGAVAGSSVSWGVHFANTTATAPFYAIFAGSSYSATSTVGYYALPLTVAYQTSTLASGAALDVIFSPITGVAQTSTSIGFYMPKENTAFSSTISIASSGAVSY